MSPDGGYTPLRQRITPVGAESPFEPRPNEEFVYVAGKLENDRGWQWFVTRHEVRHAYNRNGRLVVLKLVPTTDLINEISIMQYLNSPELRSHHANHCLPVLDVIKTSEDMGFSILVLPCWHSRHRSHFFAWQVGDYFEKAVQAFEGLAFMHEHRIFHRDISPNNITSNHLGDWDPFITPVPSPTITTYPYKLAFYDFEMATQFPPGTPMSGCTGNDSRGTRNVVAPEVSACEQNPGTYDLGPADVHALAASLLLEVQFECENLMFSIKDRRAEYSGIYAWRVLKELVPGFECLLRDAMNAIPPLRPTMAEMHVRLRALREATPRELRFAPEEGYSDYLSLMAYSIQARLI